MIDIKEETKVVLKTIDAALLKKAFLSAAKSIERKKEIINELNVFPVPDGDTGTNMTLTIMSAANDVARLADPSMEQLAKAISNGSLCGASRKTATTTAGITPRMEPRKFVITSNIINSSFMYLP